MKNLTKRQRDIARKIKSDMEEVNTILDELAESSACLITTIEEAQQNINEHGSLLIITGSTGQTKYQENPAINTRDKAIKQLNINARLLAPNKKSKDIVSELGDFLKG
ncbi:hypothetical protein VII00023_08714 [Vibrio ichthyoenteri ATCC 700023]|uniref:Uncharacterized protein n=1 Tax=Vibrio ichthyoenteri ATCC 700023 TaxID=870968 RepID=F9S5P4_9VIBR|nr:hypothetical protein [Vibrio ichthyoenteri]EGU35573.1 hypothetical protein VII00023_08714 [Vibrio ichthyoenteri ATCC 700023]